MKELEYPFDPEMLIRNRRSIKSKLKDHINDTYLEKKIAVLGGVTTKAIVQMMELFLLNYGIRPIFYESEYGRFYEDGMFQNDELELFHPDIVYICTSIRNIQVFPDINDSRSAVERKLADTVSRFTELWERVASFYHCPIIQNNFEYPFFRLLGNMDASDFHGRVNYVTELNRAFYAYAQEKEEFYICDINYLSASYGLEKWSDPYYWHMYKYATAVPAIPYLSFNISNIIKAIYGKNKKAFNLDLDNTLWGGVVGEDGSDNIEIGQETPVAQTFREFQEYLMLHKQLGILLTINSKNEEENALCGLQRPDSVLKKDDFVHIKTNWNPKSENLIKTADELNLLPESFVFVDDNPAEREIMEQQVHGVGIPPICEPEHYINMIDKSGFFETVSLSKDDLERTRMYQENVKRSQFQISFADYEEYLHSLHMKAEIREFIPEFMNRIAQLTNKSNQFNLTTHRYSQSEIESIAKDDRYITLYGRLEDKFGDNGVVSVVIGMINGACMDELYLDLWLMSCRVLKRKMEYAMMDILVEVCKRRNIRTIYGYYSPTKKNGMVRDFYIEQGFEKINEDSDCNVSYKYIIPQEYEKKQDVIKVMDV